MRYLISVSSLSKGSGLSQYVLSLCELLSKDDEVYVFLTHNGADTQYEVSELRKISPNIKLLALGADSKIRKYIHAIKLIREVKPDVIINNYNAVIQYILPLIPSHIKVVHILHNDTSDFYRVGAINGNRMTGWIAPTQGIADHFNQYTHGKYADKVTVISHGVKSVNKPIKKGSKFIEIIYAGVLYEHKGVKILPEIIRILEEKQIDFRFTIIGEGDLKDWLVNQFEPEILKGTVNLAGVVSHDEVYHYLADADIFLYPTHLDAFGLVIAEAMMNGAVPVVTRLSGVTDNLIKNGVNGFLIEQDHIEGFASTIVQLANNRDRLAKLSDASYQRASSAFSLERMRSNYTTYLRSL
jgi:glycosyltransferase involved in cell wall biosynthesis